MSDTKVQGVITEYNVDDVLLVFGLEVAEALRENSAKTFLEILIILGEFSQDSLDKRR
jgi:hypothetical protein